MDSTILADFDKIIKFSPPTTGLAPGLARKRKNNDKYKYKDNDKDKDLTSTHWFGTRVGP